jgi:hypothetical protein
VEDLGHHGTCVDQLRFNLQQEAAPFASRSQRRLSEVGKGMSVTFWRDIWVVGRELEPDAIVTTLVWCSDCHVSFN